MGGKVNPSDGDLTFLGRVLAELPINVSLGKLIMLGHVFGYLEECMVIAASLSTKSFFTRRYQEEMSSYRLVDICLNLVSPVVTGGYCKVVMMVLCPSLRWLHFYPHLSLGPRWAGPTPLPVTVWHIYMHTRCADNQMLSRLLLK